MSNTKPDFQSCCREVAEKYNVPEYAAFNNDSLYTSEAAQLYADRCVEEAIRWIPVTEMMPQKGQQVLVIGYREAELYPASGKPSVGCVYWNTAQSSPCSDTCFYSFGYNNITHWMPIPRTP